MKIGTHAFQRINAQDMLELDQGILSHGSLYYRCNNCGLVVLKGDIRYLISGVCYEWGMDPEKVTCQSVIERVIREIIE